MLDIVRDQVTGNLLRWAAGRQMFCPSCESCLDWQTTVIVSSLVICDDCFAKHLQSITDKRGHDDALSILERADITSAHNWHIIDGQVERGLLVLTDD